MVVNIVTRLGFLLLLLGSLSISAFVFQAWWVLPPVAAILLNLKVSRSMAFAGRRDHLFALLLAPAEVYMWLRMGHFVRAWLKFFSRQQTDNWAAQAKAERGKGVAWTYPFVVLLVGLVAAGAIWLQVPVDLRSDILAVGWPILGVVTVLQTAWMVAQDPEASPGVQGMSSIRSVRRRGASALVGVLALLLVGTGCSLRRRRRRRRRVRPPTRPPRRRPRSSPSTRSSPATAPSSRTSRPGARATSTSSSRSTRPSRPRAPTSGTRAARSTSPSPSRPTTSAQGLRDPFRTKRLVYLESIAVSSRTITADGGGTERPYRLQAQAADVTFDPEPVTSRRYGMLITSPKGAFELRNQAIRPTSPDTRGIELTFTAVVHVQQAAGSKRYVRRVVEQVVPIAIFESDEPTKAQQIPVNAN